MREEKKRINVMISSSKENQEERLSLTLQEAFDSTFHNKLDFNDFLELSIQDEYKKLHLKDRTNIVSPSRLLRKIHIFLNSFIFNYGKINKNVVFSYREGKSAFDAVVKHSHSKSFFQSDIRGFFESININDVARIIDLYLNDSPINDIEKHKKQLLNLVTVNSRLPVGFSTSPNISNCFLYEFDNILEEYCLGKKIIYTRYADDLIISSKKESDLDNVQEQIGNIFNKLFSERININSNKTKYTKKGRKIKILGMVILPSGKITVEPNLKSELEVLLHFYVNDKIKFRDYLEKTYSNKLSVISGKLNYINTVDKDYLNKLRKKYGNYVIDGFCHQTINKL